MTSGITIKFGKGLKNINEDLVGEINKIGLFNSSEDAVESAQEKAPYATGILKSSIASEPKFITTRTKKVSIGPRDVDYAQRREYENFKNPDRKFYMKRTFNELPRLVKENYDKAVKIVFKKKGL